MSQKILFAVIGTSGIASDHIRALQNSPKADVVFIYSRDIDRSMQFAEGFGLTPVKLYEEILNDKTIDAVDIVTEPSRHAKLALEAIKYGKHVLIEKPLDTDITLAEKLMVEAEKSPKITSVISQKRFEPTIKSMKEELERGSIGRPYLAEVKLLWERTNEYYRHGNGWRSTLGNVLINQAIHWIDIGLWFFGLPNKVQSLTTKVKESISCYDTAICCLKFTRNVLFNLVCSTAVQKSQPEEFRIYGTKGILDYNVRKNSKLRNKFSILNKAISFLNPIKSPLQCQIDEFVDSIISKKSPLVSVKDAYAALKIAKICEEENVAKK